MLASAKLVAFAATTDSARSRKFYEGLLGLRFVSEDEYAVIYDIRGIELRIQKVRTFTPQAHTLLGWYVSSIDEVVTELLHRGLAFERYTSLEQDEHGVWTAPSGARIAWLKDPDGNLLSVTEPPRG
jgi:catechol 2,3-dioxygenase-like lactoylglutathione lyase family enzyme